MRNGSMGLATECCCLWSFFTCQPPRSPYWRAKVVIYHCTHAHATFTALAKWFGLGLEENVKQVAAERRHRMDITSVWFCLRHHSDPGCIWEVSGFMKQTNDLE